MTACTVIGLGEAGAAYAAALVAAGHSVTGFDPVAPSTPAGVTRAATAAEACAAADVVLVLTGAAAAPSVAHECLPALPAGSCYADFTSSSPDVMRELGQLPGQANFADVAILGPVAALGEKTPLMVSGPGSQAVTDLLAPLGAEVEIADGEPGAAMAHKLLRSVLMKGLASVVVEPSPQAEPQDSNSGSGVRSPGSWPATARRSSTDSSAAPPSTPCAAPRKCRIPRATCPTSEFQPK
jgi:3-hydroxyisobutyrate dehydrogenase-like beta-hydroxyacid dehydrogenase